MNRRGVTLVELLVVAVIGITLYLILAAMSLQQDRVEKRNQILINAELEHRVLRNVARSLNSSSLIFILCGIPHPWATYDTATNRCLPGTQAGGAPFAPPTATELTTWAALSAEAYNWTQANRGEGGSYSPILDETYFTDKVAPLLNAPQLNAGRCMNCHDGTPSGTYFTMNGAIAGRNITKYEDVVKNPPLMSTTPLITPLGRALIPPKVMLPAFQPTKDDIGHEANFSVFPVSNCAAPTLTHRTSFHNSAVDCGFNSSGKCLATECPGACSVVCSQSTGGTGSTSTSTGTPSRSAGGRRKRGTPGGTVGTATAGTCTQWQKEIDCYTPTVLCSTTAPTPPSCPAPPAAPGATVTNCQTCNLSSSCGMGSTTWLCPDPTLPRIIPKVHYTLKTNYVDPIGSDSAKDVSLPSDGMLP